MELEEKVGVVEIHVEELVNNIYIRQEVQSHQLEGSCGDGTRCFG